MSNSNICNTSNTTNKWKIIINPFNYLCEYKEQSNKKISKQSVMDSTFGNDSIQSLSYETKKLYTIDKNK